MKPYYSDDHCTIYHGDCEDVLPSLEVADLLLADPPYNTINRHSNGLRSLDKGEADSLPVDIVKVFPLLWSRFAGAAYVWCSDEQFSGWMTQFKKAGASTRICAWNKTNPSPMNGEKIWLSGLELCVYGAKPKTYFAKHCASPCWTGSTSVDTNGHPTPKPLWLFSDLIVTSCPPGGSVIDPYMGAGTALRAAKNHGRKAIGIEINEQYCEIAAQRLSQEVFDFDAASAAT